MKDTTQAAPNCVNCLRSFTLAELQAIIFNLQSELKHSTDIQFKMGARSALSMLVAQLQTMPSTAALVENTSQAVQAVQASIATTANPAPIAIVDHVGVSYGKGPDDTTVIVCKGADSSKIKSGMQLFTSAATTPNDDIHAAAMLTVAKNGYRILEQYSNIKNFPSQDDLPLTVFANWVSSNLQTLILEQHQEIVELSLLLDNPEIKNHNNCKNELAAKNQELAVAMQELEKVRITLDQTNDIVYRTRKILSALGIRYAATFQTYEILDSSRLAYTTELIKAIELYNKSVDSPEKP